MSRTVLIDGDVLVYESSFGAQRTRYSVTTETGDIGHFDNAKLRDAWLKTKKLEAGQYKVDKHLDVLPEIAALSICKNKLAKLVEKLEATTYRVYLTGEGNFRDQVATITPYKGNRIQEKPVHYEACKQWYLNHSQTRLVNGQEADDAIGIQACRSGYTAIIASIDKDLRMIPGPHFEWHHEPDGKGFNVTPDAADRWFWMQMLMGDKADNIPGIKGLGPVRAEKLLDGATDRVGRATAVDIAYHKAYGKQWQEVATEVGRLLWIRRQVEEVWNWGDYVSGVIG